MLHVNLYFQICTPDQFGTSWSVVSTAMNVAGTAGPLLTAFIISLTDWYTCMQIAGEVH